MDHVRIDYKRIDYKRLETENNEFIYKFLFFIPHEISRYTNALSWNTRDHPYHSSHEERYSL